MKELEQGSSALFIRRAIRHSSPMVERPEGHRSFRIVLRDEQARAICTCGWQSEPSINAGMAGAMWDQHLEAMIEAADL